MPLLFAATLFISAALLFCVEPLVGKMVLPLLGGSPAVWNTCLVFFQAALLAGYLYAHASSSWLSPRSQVVLHLTLLASAVLVLPVAVAADLVEQMPPDADPVPWVLRLLVGAIGVPFVVVAASAPLLQKWFALSGHTEGRDPYFLYAASNLGSMLALLGYPLLWEPWWSLAEQSVVWTAGYGLLLLLTGTCAVFAWRAAPEKQVAETAETEEKGPTVGRRLRWVLLSAVPSSLLLGVTTYVTTDLAAIPLLWVIPLAIYLLSFIFVFARREVIPHAWMIRLLPLCLLASGSQLVLGTSIQLSFLVPLHWLTLFVACMVCHGELAHDRPAPRYLTGFYLWISFGGMVGGLFNVFLAPLVFQGRALEYLLALLLVGLLRPQLREPTVLDRRLELLTPPLICLLLMGLVINVRVTEAHPNWLGLVLLVGVPTLVCLFYHQQPVHSGLVLAGTMVGLALLALLQNSPGEILHTERNFFGIIRIQDDRQNHYRIFNHGTTIHGIQRLDEAGNLVANCEPVAYYHPSGPIGEIIRVYQERVSKGELPPRLAVTGLGAGGLASYARKGEHWTYYEIDPAVERVARDPHLFSYLADAEQRGATVDVVLGDARLRLKKADDHAYGLLIADAFTSDAVPPHLLSRQALKLYREKRAPHGLIAFHISNRYLDLRSVIADLARDAHMVCYYRHHMPSPEQVKKGNGESIWVVLADSMEDLGPLARAPWQELPSDPKRRVWDDDFYNLLSVFVWPTWF